VVGFGVVFLMMFKKVVIEEYFEKFCGIELRYYGRH